MLLCGLRLGLVVADMILHAATRDLHHAVEQTAHGRAMADGTVTAQAWADWLEAMFVLHQAVDEWLPRPLRRAEALLEDMMEMPVARPTPEAIPAFAAACWNEQTATGAGYVLTGAHLMGGALIAKRIGNRLPTRHLRWDDRPAAVAAFRPLRERGDCVSGAKECFKALLLAAKEIEANAT